MSKDGRDNGGQEEDARKDANVMGTVAERLKRIISERAIEQLEASEDPYLRGFRLRDDHPSRDRILPELWESASMSGALTIAGNHGIELLEEPDGPPDIERAYLQGILRLEAERRVAAAFEDAAAAGQRSADAREPIGICGLADVEVWGPEFAVAYMRKHVHCSHFALHTWTVTIPHQGCFYRDKAYALSYARVLKSRGVLCRATAMID